MKTILPITMLLIGFIIASCRNNSDIKTNNTDFKTEINEFECLKLLNTKLDSLFYHNCSNTKLIDRSKIKFYAKIEKKHPIVFSDLILLKSNLLDFGIDEKSVLQQLKKLNISCLNYIYNDIDHEYLLLKYNRSWVTDYIKIKKGKEMDNK
jgi:hypothetical protein